MQNKSNLFARALRCFCGKRRTETGPVQGEDMSKFESQPSIPSEKFTGIYKGYLLTREDPGSDAYTQTDEECTFLLSYDNMKQGNADIYLAGEPIGTGLSANISSNTLTLNGILWSSDFAFQGTFCYKTRVMKLTGDGILKDTGDRIKIEVVMVDEWKRPLNKGDIHPV